MLLTEPCFQFAEIPGLRLVVQQNNHNSIYADSAFAQLIQCILSRELRGRCVIVPPDIPSTNSIDYNAGESLSTAAIAHQILDDQYTAILILLLLLQTFIQLDMCYVTEATMSFH